MRRRHLVRNAVGRCRLAHGDAYVPRLGTVVYFGKDVRMNVDHSDLREHRHTPAVALNSI
jgi:hypothetical protein